MNIQSEGTDDKEIGIQIRERMLKKDSMLKRSLGCSPVIQISPRILANSSLITYDNHGD